MTKIVNITNGVGTESLINGNYTVEANINGYNNSSINPNTVNISDGTNSYAFTISATGTLTLHVTDNGTITGNPIVGATFKRTDSNGTEYGNIVTTDSNGDAIFNNVPFSTTSAPLIYYKQLSSDGEHEFLTTVASTSMTNETQTIEIQNPIGATRTINLTDTNYENLPIETGSLTLTN